MKNISIKFALIAFAITVTWTLIEHTLGYNTTNHQVGQHTRLFSAFIFYAGVALAVFETRKRNSNALTFAQGFKAGATVAVLYGVLVTIWFALYGEVINKQYRPTLIAFERSKLEAAHATPEMVAEKMKEVEMTSGGSIVSYLLLFVFMTLMGVVIAALSALIFKRRQKLVQVIR